MAIVLAHWGEHLVQAYQIYVMGWPRPKANGILGLWYPWLIKSETLHYGYAVVMLLASGFCVRDLPDRATWWTVALVIQFWHHIEHFLLITQATRHHNFWGKPVPVQRAATYFPRVELHSSTTPLCSFPWSLACTTTCFLPRVKKAFRFALASGINTRRSRQPTLPRRINPRPAIAGVPGIIRVNCAYAV